MGSTHDQHKYSTPSDEDETAAFIRANQLASAYAIPMTLKAVIEIGILEIIHNAGPGCQLSAAEISARTSPANPQGSAVLDRMLKYLASNSVLTCSVVEGDRGRLERRYGLAPLCKFFIDRGDGRTIAPLLLMFQDKVLQDSWQELKYAYLEGVIPFKKAHGMNAFEYHATDQRFNRVFNNGMSGISTLLMKKMLDSYTGFQGIGKLVDVGGGIGSTLQIIVSKFPNVKGINFDLPHVVSEAPLVPGVEHIGGDMFVSIPTADAIFMKWILHDWSDEHCVKILKNCLQAIPDSGKVIIIETNVPETPEIDAATQIKLYGDLSMLTYNIGGKERTEKEFELIAKEAGFSEFKVVSPIYNFSVMELFK